MKFSSEDFFSRCELISIILSICSHSDLSEELNDISLLSFDYFKPAFVELYYVQQATFFIAPVT